MRRNSEHQVLQAIDRRRLRGVVCDSRELQARIDALGDMSLNTRGRQSAFSEVYASLTPSGFHLLSWPNDTKIHLDGHKLSLSAVLVRRGERQIAAEIVRQFQLDNHFVSHRLMRVQDAYRGAGLSNMLLNQAFSFYRQLGLVAVVVHAALQTGRWQWARVGFEFERSSRPLIEGWAALCMLAMGLKPLAPGFRASQLALMGTEPGGTRVSFTTLRAELERTSARLRSDTQTYRAISQIQSQCEKRLRTESRHRWRLLDEARFHRLADWHGVEYDQEIPLGKAIMLAGPDWHGVFDLGDRVAQQVFDAEFYRRFANLAA